MKKFVRGGMILTVLSMCVVFIYASSNETEVLSQRTIRNRFLKM